MNSIFARMCYAILAVTLFAATPLSLSAQDETSLPDNLQQLIQIKTPLLQQYAELQKAGDDDKAIQVLRSIVNIHRKAYQVATENKESEELIIKLRNVYGNDGEYFSDELFRRSEFTESARLRAELVKLFDDVLGPEHPSSRMLRFKLIAAEKISEAPEAQQVAFSRATETETQGSQAMKDGQYDVAADLYSQLVDARVAVLGESHPFVASALNELGQALWLQQEYKSAETAYLRSLEARESTMGKDLQYAGTSYNLGRLYQDTERFAEAETAYLTTAEIEESILGNTHESFLQTLQQLASMYDKAGETEKLAAVQQRISVADPFATIVSHLPKGTIAAAAARPSLLPSDPNLQMMPFEVIEAAGQQELGLNPLDVDACIVFGTMPVGEPTFNFGFLWRMKTGVSSDFSWLKPDDGEEIPFGDGQSYWKANSDTAEASCSVQFSDGTVLIGTEETVRQCLTHAGGSSVGSMLLQSKDNGHIVAAVNMEIIRGFVMAALQEAPPAPPALEGLKSLPADVNSVQAWLSFSQGLQMSLVLNTVDEDAAARTSTALVDALALGQQLATEEMTKNMASDDPIQLATLAYAQRVANRYFSQIQPVVDSTTVSIEANLIDPSVVSGPVAIALLLPAVQQAREAARRTTDRNSLKMIGLALHNYHDANDAFPPRANYDKDGNPLLSWRVHLLPYLEENELYEQFHLDEPWNSEHNLTLLNRMPNVYKSMSLEAADATVFLTADGAGTMMEGDKGISFADVTDGSSNTIFVMEANPENAVAWTKPEDLPFDPGNPKNGLGEFRPMGFQVLLADGSIRFIAIAIDDETLRNLILRNDGNVVDNF